MSAVVLTVDDLREQYMREMALVRQTCDRTGDELFFSGAIPM